MADNRNYIQGKYVVATVGQQVTINIVKKVSSYTSTITAKIGQKTVSIGSAKTSATSLTWTPPISLYTEFVGIAGIIGTVKVETYNGTTLVGTWECEIELSAGTIYYAPQILLISTRGTYSNNVWTQNPTGRDLKIEMVSRITPISGVATYVNLKIDSTYIDTIQVTSGTKVYYRTNVDGAVRHTITAEATDTIGSTVTATNIVPVLSVPFDLNVDIPAVAFGKVAEFEKTVELADGWTLTWRDLQDYAVEKGFNGDWTFVKYNSGLAKCYCTKTITVTVGTASGNLYYGDSPNIDFPIDFIELPSIVATANSTTTTNAIASVINVANTSCGIRLFRGNTAASASYRVSIQVEGKWK